MGVSLWLMPMAAQINLIKSVLPKSPSVVNQPLSPSSYPVFLPHITLATVPLGSGSPDMLLDAIPENQPQVHANFQSLAVGNHYYRSVFIDVQPTPEIVDLQSRIATHLRRRGLEPGAPRFPHMSLCYIADADEGERERTAQALRDTGVVNERVDSGARSISLQCGDVTLPGVDGVEIWAVQCDGPVGSWEIDARKVTLSPWI